MFVDQYVSPSNSRPSSSATEGLPSSSSPVVGTLLQFQPEEEHKFQLSVSRDRLKSSRRVDTTLFSLLALFMMTGWKRVYVAGHADEMPYMALSGVVYSCCTMLYLRRASPGGLLEIIQLKMRVPLHIFTYSLAMLLFSRHIALPNMGACSPFLPEFSALEALVVYLLWAASYPTMAAIPLRYAIPIQLFAYWGIEGASAKECSMGDICSQTDSMYHLYMQATAKFASSLPISLSSYSHSIPLDCRSVMGFLKLFIIVALSLYMTYTFELNTRVRYASESGKVEIVSALLRKKMHIWQLFVECLVACAVCWHATFFAQQAMLKLI